MSENTGIARLSENSVMPFLAPKKGDLIRLIGQDRLTKEFSFAIQAANSNAYLATATPASVAKAIFNVGITGLTLNPIHKQAYLTPRKINNVVEAVLMPSYRGLVYLITDTGSVKNIYAHVVYKGDDFKVSFGTEMGLTHIPNFKSIANDDITHVYAVAILADGSKQFEVMGIEEIHKIRERSDSYRAFKSNGKSTMWETDKGEMCRKTVIKRLTKYLPQDHKSEKWERVNNAIKADDGEYPMTDGQMQYILSLLSNSTYDHERRNSIEVRLESYMTSIEAESIIDDLRQNQLNPITHGGNPSAKEINNEVNGKIG